MPLRPAFTHPLPIVSPVWRTCQKKTGALLLGLGLATFMEFYTYDSVNLVLPDIAGTLGISQDEASWILTTYSSALFLGVPLSIGLARYVGHVRFIVSSIVLFTVASVGCADSSNLVGMLCWRVIQGFAGAGLTVWWRAAIYMLFPGPSRSKPLMYVSMMLYLATASGLVVGGWITDNIGWRLLFLVNVPFAVIAIWLIIRHFPDMPAATDPRLARMDWFGIALLAVSIVSLQIFLSRGSAEGWFDSPKLQALACLSSVTFVGFASWQASARNGAPLFRIALLRNRNVLAAVGLGIMSGLIVSGSLYALPEYLRNVASQPHTALMTGEIMCVYALTACLLRPFATSGISKLGQRKATVLALLMLVASMLSINRLMTPETPDVAYFIPLVLYGLCLSPLLSAVGRGTVSMLPQADQLDAVAYYMGFRQLGAALGVATITAILNQREMLHSSRLFEHLQKSGVLTQQWLSSAATVLTASGGYAPDRAQNMAVGLLRKVAIRQAQTLAYADAFVVMTLIGIFAICIVPLMSPSSVNKK